MDSKLEHLICDIERLNSLGDNWDGEGAHNLTREVLEEAKRCIRHLYSRIGFLPDKIVPLSNGCFQIEYDSDKKSVEIELTSRGIYAILLGGARKDSKEMHNLSLDEITKKLKKYLNDRKV